MKIKSSIYALVSQLILVQTFFANDVLRSDEDEVLQRTQVYDRGTWTIAYVPEATSGEQAPHGNSFHILQPNNTYLLLKEKPQTQYCFIVSHRSDQYANEPSYLGVASFSVLSDNTNPKRPLLMFRSTGWFKSGRFLEKRASIPSIIPPGRFFDAHATPIDLKERELRQIHSWHASYSKGENNHSWLDHDLWDLRERLENVITDNNFDVNWQNTRLDAMLIRFKFTEKRDSVKPPRFCIASQNRTLSIIMVLSPYIAQSLRFIVSYGDY